MIIIHLTRSQRRKLRELHPRLNNMYFSRALRFQNNSPLSIRNDALKLGGKLLTQLPTPQKLLTHTLSLKKTTKNNNRMTTAAIITNVTHKTTKICRDGQERHFLEVQFKKPYANRLYINMNLLKK